MMGARVHGTLPGAEVASYSVDSRTIAPGALFFALRGPANDGHDFVEAAFAKGAVAAVVEHEMKVAGPQLIVDDSLAALQRLACAARRLWGTKPGRVVIGVTGSAGKTTTKDAIAAAIAAVRPTDKTAGNYNNHVGVPLSVLHLKEEAEVAVLEIGMNHAGEIRDLARIVRPDIGVVTNVGTAHIENFDSIEGIAGAKRELIESLPPAGTAILNADDPRVAAFSAIHPGRTITYGLGEKASIRAESVQLGVDGATFSVAGAGEFHCPLPGRSGILAALAALACGRALGLDLAVLKEPIARLMPGKMRFERLTHEGMTVWNDCYNSNPEAAKMMLELLAQTPAHNRIAVLGEMLELGPWSRELHSEVGRYAVQSGISALVGIHGGALFMVEAARDAGLDVQAASYFDEPGEAGRFVKQIARRGDALLFKGSRGTRVELALQEFLK
jgi:UDP-N-acetylmuramoyl-tripeptide--D-alanyl-D-alanine ligase